MARYLVRRLALTVVVVLLVMVLLVSLVHLIPGDPAHTVLGLRASPELVQQVRREMELDRPVYVQMLHYIENAAHGDLGEEFLTGTPVTTLILQALPHTIALAVTSLLLAVIVGVPLGVYAATRPNSHFDHITGILSVSFITMPAYVAGLLLLTVFSVNLGVTPAIGAGSFSDPLDYAWHLLLPTIALALTWIGYIARLVRTSMLEVLNTNYIRTATALGLNQRTVTYKYALRNAIIPTVAVLGVGLGSLMAGAVFIEAIFTRPGLGTLMLSAIQTRNYPILQGCVLVVSLLFVTANLLADISYRVLDPRTRVEAVGA